MASRMELLRKQSSSARAAPAPAPAPAPTRRDEPEPVYRDAPVRRDAPAPAPARRDAPMPTRRDEPEPVSRHLEDFVNGIVGSVTNHLVPFITEALHQKGYENISEQDIRNIILVEQEQVREITERSVGNLVGGISQRPGSQGSRTNTPGRPRQYEEAPPPSQHRGAPPPSQQRGAPPSQHRGAPPPKNFPPSGSDDPFGEELAPILEGGGRGRSSAPRGQLPAPRGQSRVVNEEEEFRAPPPSRGRGGTRRV